MSRTQVGLFLSSNIVGGILLAVTALIPVTASAQDRASVAQHHYSEGRRFYALGQFDEAFEHFQASLDAFDSPNARLYLARSLRELGRSSEAVAAYELAARVANDLSRTSPRYRETAEAAQRELDELERQISRLIVFVEPSSADFSISIGARELPSSAIGVPLPVEPGQIEVRATAPGYEPAEERLTVTAGGATTITLVLDPVVEEGAVGDTEGPSYRSLTAVGWSGLALGVVGGALFAGFGGAALSRFNDLQDQCSGGPCSGNEVPSIHQGRRYELVANVSLGVGVGLAVTGAICLIIEALLTRRSERAPESPSEE